jgi:hypothetical protein
MTKPQFPAYQKAEEEIKHDLENMLNHAAVAYELQEAADSNDAERLQAAADDISKHMQGLLKGAHWMASKIFHALIRDGFMEASDKPSEAIYLMEALGRMVKENTPLTCDLSENTNANGPLQ